jgi:N-acetylneuraminic acid mutarotase
MADIQMQNQKETPMKEMKQILLGKSPIRIKRNLGRVAIALLLISSAIACSLTTWATSPGYGSAPGKTSNIVNTFSVAGDSTNNPLGGITVAPPFDANYSLFNLGPVPNVPTYYGGITFKYDDPNTLLIGGAADSPVGHIYQVAVARDENGHVTGFVGNATLYPGVGSTIGQYNDAGLVFGPDNVLFVTRWPASQLEQSKVGSLAPDKVIELAPLGVTGTGGSIGFVPPGFPGAGSMKLISWSGGGWYHCEFTPDGNGTFNITSATLRANISSPEGIAFVPPSSPVFPANSVLIVQYGYGKVVTAPLDANGDPIVASSQDFIRGLTGPDGACTDPVTGDFLFSPWGGNAQLLRVSGFATPSPSPTPSPSCTPQPWIGMEDYPFAVDSAALVTDGTFAYAFGGSSSTGGQHAEANRFDVYNNTWMPIASMNTGQDFYLHGEYGGNGKIYVIGGAFNQSANRIYDIGTNTWSAGTLVPVGVYGYGHAYANGKIYVLGGYVGGNYSSTVYAYDVASNTWSAPLAPLPQGEVEMACGVINNKIYVAGGSDGDNVLNNLYVYDIDTNSWTGGAPMPVRADAPAGTVVAGKLWVIGGRDASGATLSNTQIYDPATNSWFNGPPLIPARAFADAITANEPSGQMPVIVGGYSVGIGSLTNVKTSFPACQDPTPTPTATATATATATPTATATATATPTSTPTATATATATATPTPTATATATATPTSTPAATPTPTPAAGCVQPQGYWKTHAHWPVNQLQLGNRVYGRQQLQSILTGNVGNNGLISLAREQIAAKLNIANGANGTCIGQKLARSDALIGNLVVPPVGDGFLTNRKVAGYVRGLKRYNEGQLCAPHCH